MKDKIKNIAEKLEHQIRMHELDLNDRIKDIPQIILLLEQGFSELKEIVSFYKFKSEMDEIFFFKIIKPKFFSKRYFRKGGDNRTHQIHIFEQSNHKDINRHIAVRDFLRTHPDIALEYGELKMELAYRFSEDIEGYCTGKDAFVKQLEKDALLWYQNNESYKTR